MFDPVRNKCKFTYDGKESDVKSY